MFSLLAKLLSLALDWGKLTGHKVKEKDTLNCTGDFVKSKNFSGTVTSINALENYGIIDRVVYFSFDVVYLNTNLKVGDKVLVQASRKAAYHGWIATYVEYLKCNTASTKNSGHKQSGGAVESIQKKTCTDSNAAMTSVYCNSVSNETMDRTETIDQVISECNDNGGKLRDGTEFLLENSRVEFFPIVGDFIAATIRYSSQGKTVVSWEPKEIKCMLGTITAYENDCGVIDDEIVFFRNSCRRKISLRVGQKVSALVATSEQGLFKWRAFSINTPCLDSDSENEDVDDDESKPVLHEKEGIAITEPLSFDNILLGKENSLVVLLENNTSSDLKLLNCYFQSRNGLFYIGKNIAYGECIPDNGSIEISVHCKTEALGQHEDFLLFEFSDFFIKRSVTVTIIDPMQHLLNPTAPFSRVSKSQRNHFDCEDLVIIPGRKPYKPVSLFSNKLPPCNVPKSLIRAVQNREDLKYVIPNVFKNLTMHNYVTKFSNLLHLEEIQARFDLKKFDLTEVILRRKGEFLALEVIGLAEGRPSLIVGDKAIVVPTYKKSSFGFEGCIHEVHLNEVLLKFNDSFHNTYDGELFDVRFELNRTNFRRLHQCVQQVSENHEYAIFPSKLVLKDPLVDLNLVKNGYLAKGCKRQKHHQNSAKKATLQWKNTQLNWKQKEAVSRILECRCRPLPYIIFGPPGTGKTVTLVESVLQVYENIPYSKIIICTPSNSAADLVAQRIIESNLIGIEEMVRLNSYQRSVDSIPEFIKPYCQDKDSLEYIAKFRIIISTCSTAGSLYSIGLCNEFFTHVFIDEAGQLMEPESNIALGFTDSQTMGQVVMAGDPKQLGPVLRSSHAVTYGLQVSYLERLMNTALFARNEREYEQYGGYNPLLITMLEESYRSHPHIIQFPSDVFYFSQIVCRFPADKVCELSNWDELPTKGFPVIFHGVKGEEMREQNSPSWFNPAEVVQVTKYLQKLYNFGLMPNDVGIIAPYKKQVEKIRMLLTALGLEFCKIGSVEEFQGQERRAIIISTVRSSDQYIDCDILYNLGFMSNPKRLNVAITRSQELLIVVGNPYILSKDFFWHSLVRYCVVNGCYTGCELPLSFIQNKSAS